MDYNFDEEIGRFISYIESQEITLPLVAAVFDSILKKQKKELKDFHDIMEKVSDEDGNPHSRIPRAKVTSFLKLERRVDNLIIASKVIPRNHLVSFVSIYDAFLGRLIRTMYYIKPELLNASQKNITLSELMSYDTLDSVKEHFIEKEVDSVLRDSHSDHFEWLEKKLDIPLRKGLDIWSSFIELTERRNLFVHCDGIVSSQYLSVCKKHMYKFDKEPAIGDSLECNSKYLRNASNVICEIGIKLGQVIWRKLQPSEIKDADSNLSELTFEFISNKNYDLAIALLEFAINTFKKSILDESKYYFIINLAQAYKWKGNEEKMRDTLSSVDWNPLSFKFRLGYEVLTDQFAKASLLMKQIGTHGEISKESYTEWPLFNKFRESDDFQQAFLEVFGEPYQVLKETRENQKEEIVSS